MNNQDLLEIAMAQSAIDSNCNAEDFKASTHKVVVSAPDESGRARRYLSLPFICDLTTYGGAIVASVSPELVEPISRYLGAFQSEHCFETPNMLVLQDYLAPLGLSICFMAEYFLPDLGVLKALPCAYETRILASEDFKDLYIPEWSNALGASRPHLDVLGLGAYHDNTLIGLAACSADCDTMWQIGVDVLPAYRNRGIASTLTSQLALEVLKRGKVPFYCCAWSNISSVRNAIKSGFKPAWVQMTIKTRSQVDAFNSNFKL